MGSPPLEPAILEWRNDHTPVSSRYGDLYFSADDGCAESRHVFISNNDLPERFSKLQTGHFTIAETGFGTGLNFLLAWQLWQHHATEGKRLCYISAECHPLSKDDMEKSLACWPQFSREAAILLDKYPPAIRGIHPIELATDISLVLLFDDAVAGYRSLLENPPTIPGHDKPAVDAWFLDGFAPAKNPDMWSDELFNCMARLSHTGTTFSSFTAAGDVRRGLQAAGFDVKKTRGFGRKRDMIRGAFAGLPAVI